MTKKFASEPRHQRYDAVVVGSGPNGFAAAITLARAKKSVLVIEAENTIGGGMRTAELTLPGFQSDICSAIHALGVCSPFFLDIPLQEHGLEWIYPDAAVAHPLPDGSAAIAQKSVADTASSLGRDADAYARLYEPLVERADDLLGQLLGPFRIPRHPALLTRFGMSAIRSAASLAKRRFNTAEGQALFAGHAAHAILPLDKMFTAAVGLMLSLTVHRGGWPIAKGGSQAIADALASYLESLDGEIIVGNRVESLEELPDHGVALFDVSPPAMTKICGNALPVRYRNQLDRFRFGPGAYKLDWALDGPIPWENEQCGRAGTVHVGGSLAEVASAEQAPWRNECHERPFVLVAQQSLFDASRAPAGKQVAWGYCHVPPYSKVDMTERIEAQVERFAPGFRERILARHVTSPTAFESYNANYIGGDITGGVMDIWQLFTRPAIRVNPYTTPNRKILICSASTPPGPGVHGMCGYYAAQTALQRI